MELVFRWVQTIFKAAVARSRDPVVAVWSDQAAQHRCVEVVPMAPETVEALADTIAARYRALIML